MNQDDPPLIRAIERQISSKSELKEPSGLPAENNETKKSGEFKASDEESSTSSSSSGKEAKGAINNAILEWSTANSGWVKQNWTWSKLKPALRCAVVGWASIVLFVIPAVERRLGQASFLILIGPVASFLSPPLDPFISTLERESLILLFISVGWAWSCLGIYLADLARTVHNPGATIFEVATGKYIEAAPSIILAVFIFFGSSILLYIKARQGPGPYLFASIFGCLCIDTVLTTSALFPYPYYRVGQSIAIPLACHSALSLLGSLFIFPSTISTQFTTRLQDVLSPLLTTLSLHERLLSTSRTSPEFGPTLASLRLQTKGSEGKLVPLAAAARLLKTDLIFSRFSPSDFKIFQAIERKLTARADGMAMYFGLVDPERERFPGTEDDMGMGEESASGTVPNTPSEQRSRVQSRDRSPEREDDTADSPTSPSVAEDVTLPNHPLTPSHSHSPHAESSHHHFPSLSLSSPFHKKTSSSDQHDSNRHHHHHHHRQHHDLLHQSLLTTITHATRKKEKSVGAFEAQRYLNLESTRFHDPNEEYYLNVGKDLLRECCTPLLNASHLGLSEVSTWLSSAHLGRTAYIRDTLILCILGSKLGKGATKSEQRRRAAYEDRMRELKKVKDEIERARRVFREDTRHFILEPYEAVFPDPPSARRANTSSRDADTKEPINLENPTSQRNKTSRMLPPLKLDEGELKKKAPAHRFLFFCYVYQYHLLHFSGDVIEMLDEIVKLEKERPWPSSRFWMPVLNAFKWDITLVADQGDDDDDNPDLIQGLQHDKDADTETMTSSTTAGARKPAHSAYSSQNDLGLAHRRDPDALPPRNIIEWVLNLVYRIVTGLGGGNSMFAIKAGMLTVILCLPSFIKSSAEFAYENRFVWAIFMGQLTLSRFRGDTAFGLTIRVASTFGGGLVGMVVWYTSTGLGHGNPYGLAAVCAVCFPFFFFARLYWPVHPMTNIIFFVTTVLVIGYSYQDAILLLPGSPGFGYTVAWRRFVLVTAGVTAAFYQRHLLSTTSCELGSIYCSILSFANSKHDGDKHEILASLIAVRNKLKRSTELRSKVQYEFSFRGRWPMNRYRKIAELQMAIAYSLSHLISVIKHLEPSWTIAFLRRTRFLDPDFQGDLLAVISMVSNSLRTGSPLPQITPCPLLDRFTLRYHGLNVIHKEAKEDYGLPRTLTLDTLRNEQYLIFCVGVATAYSIVNRLDMLMVAVKQLVGEQYHIHGVGLPMQQQSNLPLHLGMDVGSSGLPAGRESQGHFVEKGAV
ncbi:hypothetical protein CPB83DRAFT_840925 [Crepidotus variabilis]|uniref:DUF2421 domain-containing protein n=1 Tax=Crepidotus variabilis TaxID=179855 RepID=A0A9P6E3L0_9AGAR|nr:hypothetical protein CPB83DRAFT_840925 [Crepidotus variabilis]